METRAELLSRTIEHVDITQHDVVSLVDGMRRMAFSARDLARAAEIYEMMVRDSDCGIILCLAGSLISAGLKKVFVQMIRSNMVDGIVSTGANIVDQDFFESLGFRHYIAPDYLKAGLHDGMLRDFRIDRIYDTLIDEDELRICDETCKMIADNLDPRPYSSREYVRELGAFIDKNGKSRESIVLAAYEKDVPIFCPAFSDCSAGLGLIVHHHERGPAERLSIDSVKDFYELTQLKMANPTTGLFMIGGGTPKNFAQDIVVAADILGADPPMHKYAVQITVADVRDGALSSSTLKEASSWGKVDTAFEQMVYAEATLAVPLVVGYVYHKGTWQARRPRKWTNVLDRQSSSQLQPVR